MSDYILEMKDINKSFYGVSVLKNAHLEVLPGEVHVLLGENGAGKSTMMKILSGAYKKDSGQVLFMGNEISASSETDIKRMIDMGISVIYQEFNLNPFTPIYENIFLGREFSKGLFLDKKKAIEESKQYMDMVGLETDPTTLVQNLSVSQKQLVEIAKAISLNVKILVLDEPTAAITERETRKLFEIIRNLKEQGVGIIYISHRMQELFEIGDRCTVMRNGETIKTLRLEDTNIDELTQLMAGRKINTDSEVKNFSDPSVIALRVENLNYKNLLHDISFDLHKGEILGFAGLIGAGRTELAKCIIGDYKRSSGDVYLDNLTKKLPPQGIRTAIENKLVYLSEDRKDEGVVLDHSVLDNITLPSLDSFSKLFVNQKAIIKNAEKQVEQLRIKTHSISTLVKNLSGGNIQKVVIAKWLTNNANVYIFDEPTRGIDVGARQEIYAIMERLAQEGASIIMISSDMNEIMRMCNRIAVMREGRISTVLENDANLSQDLILKYALPGGDSNE